MQTNLNWLLILIKTIAILLKFRQEDTFVWDFQFLKSSCPWRKELWVKPRVSSLTFLKLPISTYVSCFLVVRVA